MHRSNRLIFTLNLSEMKAVIAAEYGPPDILQIREVEKPVSRDNEILIKVYATTVNRTDCANLRAKPVIMRLITGLSKPRKIIPGTDFAGVVEAVGKKVASFRIGDEVFGFNDTGLRSYAQYMSFSANDAVSTIPGNISFEQAAAAMEGVHYAYNMINKVKLHPGHKVLVNGASGAIGSAAVQLLKYFKARITAVCNTKNLVLVKSIGADVVIDYLNEDFTRTTDTYHFIFDTVGKSTFKKCKPLLKPGGVYISSELGRMSQNLFFALFTPLFSGKKVKFPFPVNRKRTLTFIKKLIEQEKFQPVIDRTYPMEQITEAFKYVETGQKTGNVVITYD